MEVVVLLTWALQLSSIGKWSLPTLWDSINLQKYLHIAI